MTAHLRLGAQGEVLAARYLESTGLVVLDRNWRCRFGELDLILTDRSKLVVCEVKTRASAAFGTPAEAVTSAKASRIRRLATQWRQDHGVHRVEVRYDIVSVLWPPGEPPQVHHLKAAF
jgi:putative endonuclease